MTFTHRNAVNLYFVYELNTWSKDLNMDFTLGDCQFGELKLTKNVNPNKFNDLMHFHNFHCRLVNGVQMLLYLGWIKSSSRHTSNGKKRYSSSW